MINTIEFGKRLKSIRQSKKMSQAKLSELSGISVQTISSYETGHSSPILENIYDIALILNVSLDYLVYGEMTNINLLNDEKIDNVKTFFNKILNLIDTGLVSANVRDIAFMPKAVTLQIDNKELVDKFIEIKKYVDDRQKLGQSTYRLIINTILDNDNKKL